jgi:hypothetical protein
MAKKEEREVERTMMYQLAPAGDGILYQIFDHPDDVPKNEGWEDSPAKFMKKTQKSKRPEV